MKLVLFLSCVALLACVAFGDLESMQRDAERQYHTHRLVSLEPALHESGRESVPAYRMWDLRHKNVIGHLDMVHDPHFNKKIGVESSTCHFIGHLRGAPGSSVTLQLCPGHTPSGAMLLPAAVGESPKLHIRGMELGGPTTAVDGTIVALFQPEAVRLAGLNAEQARAVHRLGEPGALATYEQTDDSGKPMVIHTSMPTGELSSLTSASDVQEYVMKAVQDAYDYHSTEAAVQDSDVVEEEEEEEEEESLSDTNSLEDSDDDDSGLGSRKAAIHAGMQIPVTADEEECLKSASLADGTRPCADALTAEPTPQIMEDTIANDEQTYYIELRFVIDKTFQGYYGGDKTKITQRLQSIINDANGFYKAFDAVAGAPLRITLTDTVGLNQDPDWLMAVGKEIKASVATFNFNDDPPAGGKPKNGCPAGINALFAGFIKSYGKRAAFDHSTFWYGKKMDSTGQANKVVGVSRTGAMCSASESCSIVSDTDPDNNKGQIAGWTLGHELFHSLGAKHSDKFGGFMYPVAIINADRLRTVAGSQGLNAQNIAALKDSLERRTCLRSLGKESRCAGLGGQCASTCPGSSDSFKGASANPLCDTAGTVCCVPKSTGVKSVTAEQCLFMRPLKASGNCEITNYCAEEKSLWWESYSVIEVPSDANKIKTGCPHCQPGKGKPNKQGSIKAQCTAYKPDW